jgi:hypothetical protein
MARVDYEAAWQELAETIGSRESGWGTRNLLAEMTRIGARHRVSETLLERTLRLYGGQLTLTVQTPEVYPSDLGGTTPPAVAEGPGSPKTEGGRDGKHEHAGRGT